MKTTKSSSDSPSLEFNSHGPQLYLKKGSRYQKAEPAEVLGAAVMLLQSLPGGARLAFAVQIQLPSLLQRG